MQFQHDHPKTFYLQLYFETFGNSFDQPDYQISVHLQELLIKVFKAQDDDLGRLGR